MLHAERLLTLGKLPELHLLTISLPSTLLFRLQSDHPDVILIAEGEEFLARTTHERSAFAEAFAGTPVVLLVARLTGAIVRQAARINIHSVLPIEVSAHQLVTAISATVAGFAVTIPTPQAPSSSRMRMTEELTAREVEILRLMARGRTNKQMAAQLGISRHTAKFHVSSVLAKLGAGSRTEAVTIGVTRGLVAI
jgi:DNA-binding NarL/FixJ family response regulator